MIHSGQIKFPARIDFRLILKFWDGCTGQTHERMDSLCKNKDKYRL